MTGYLHGEDGMGLVLFLENDDEGDAPPVDPAFRLEAYEHNGIGYLRLSNGVLEQSIDVQLTTNQLSELVVGLQELQKRLGQ